MIKYNLARYMQVVVTSHVVIQNKMNQNSSLPWYEPFCDTGTDVRLLIELLRGDLLGVGPSRPQKLPCSALPPRTSTSLRDMRNPGTLDELE